MARLSVLLRMYQPGGSLEALYVPPLMQDLILIMGLTRYDPRCVLNAPTVASHCTLRHNRGGNSHVLHCPRPTLLQPALLQ